MLNKMYNSIRTKVIAAIGLSAGAAILATYILLLFAQRLNGSNSIVGFFLRLVKNSVGVQIIVFGTGLLLFIITFFLLTRQTMQRIEQIISAVKQMEGGSLGTRIEVKSTDEIGELAAAINSMADKIKKSIDEEHETEQAKRDLITSVSHDLRTPLTSIIGFQGLLMDRSRHTDSELERYAAIAHKKALRLQSLIDELFEYTKVSNSGIRLDKQVINLNELTGQMVEEFYPVFEQAGMQCRLTIPDQRINVLADGELLHRLLENLLNNAVKYGSEGGFIDVMMQYAAGNAELNIMNYGKAIPPEHLENIFQRFYRVEQSRSRQTGGTGLGLAIAANIVELHGGSIKAASDSQRTCFIVKLPAIGIGKGERDA